MKIKIKKLHPDAVIPKYAHDTDAGMDLVAVSAYVKNVEIETPGYIKRDKPLLQTLYVEYGTGIAIKIPYGYLGLLFPRSSVSNRHLVMSNSVGVIDSGYTGEIKMRFYTGNQSTAYLIGDRIGQLIIIPYPKVEFEEVTELSETERGNGGFGSTGL